jgi:ABC-type multidrug transport system ATPase subunit
VTALLQTRLLKAGYLGREVVQAVNLRVEKGEVVCLLGPNGAGKTTTLLTIAGELDPVDGLVMFNNVPTFTPMYQRIRDGGIGCRCAAACFQAASSRCWRWREH